MRAVKREKERGGEEKRRYSLHIKMKKPKFCVTMSLGWTFTISLKSRRKLPESNLTCTDAKGRISGQGLGVLPGTFADCIPSNFKAFRLQRLSDLYTFFISTDQTESDPCVRRYYPGAITYCNISYAC